MAKAKNISNKTQDADLEKIDLLLELFNRDHILPNPTSQGYIYETALASLVTVLGFSGNIKHLYESLPHKEGKEINLVDIFNTMVNLGYISSEIDLSIEKIDSRLIPCLFIPDDDKQNPLVILGIKNDYITVINTSTKTKELILVTAIEGRVYFFKKIDPEKIKDDTQIKKQAGMTWFGIIFSRFHPLMKEIIIASIFVNILALAVPIYIMTIYDKVINANSIPTMYNLLIGVMIAIFSGIFLKVIRMKSVIWLGVRLDNIVSNTIFEKLLLMQAFHTEGASISAQMSRIKSFQSVRNFFAGPLFSVVVELPFTIILLFAVWVLTGKLVYIPIAVLILFVLLLYYFRIKLRVSMYEAGKKSAVRQEYGLETFIKMQSLHANGLSQNWLNKYKEKLSDAAISSFNSAMISSIIETVAHAISLIAGVSVVTFGVLMIWNNEITVGALVATMILIWRILGPLQTLCSMLPRIEQLKNSIDQINNLANIETERHPSVIKRPIEEMKGQVQLSNVGLRYSADAEPVFVGLDLDVKPGEVIGITGSNGSGKSSILKIINGLYSPQTGVIRIDGANIKQLEPIELRYYINYYPQNPNFFEGKIRDNLLIVNPFATEEDVIDALQRAYVYEDIKKYKNGLNTFIRGNYSNLPSSIRYKLNLARVFLKRSNILLLDELPNSALNEDIGKVYREIIIEAQGKRTLFFVSQRDDYLKLANRIIMCKSGTRPKVVSAKEFLNQNN